MHFSYFRLKLDREALLGFLLKCLTSGIRHDFFYNSPITTSDFELRAHSVKQRQQLEMHDACSTRQINIAIITLAYKSAILVFSGELSRNQEHNLNLKFFMYVLIEKINKFDRFLCCLEPMRGVSYCLNVCEGACVFSFANTRKKLNGLKKITIAGHNFVSILGHLRVILVA